MKKNKKEYFSFLRDANGKLSRKAIAGYPCIFVYIHLLLRMIDDKIIVTDTQYSLMVHLLYVGGGLLGLSIFEFINKFKK